MSTIETDWWRRNLQGEPIADDGARVFFHRPDGPPPAVEQSSPASWTNVRREQYAWYANHLGNLPDGARVIDVGCGPGQFHGLMNRFAVCGIDHAAYAPANIVADLERPLPLTDACADLAVMSNVLEHCYQPLSLLREIGRVLRPGGLVMIAVPFFAKVHQAPHDYFRYTQFALERMSRDAGLNPLAVEGIGNVFGVYRVVRSGRDKHVFAATRGPRRLAARVAFKIQSVADKILSATFPTEGRDTLGYPHSFGLIAERPNGQ